MKKTVAIFSSILFTLVIISCGGANNGNSNKDSSTDENQKSTLIGRTYIGSGGSAARSYWGFHFLDEKKRIKIYKGGDGDTYSAIVPYSVQDKKIIIEANTKWEISLEVISENFLREDRRLLFLTESFEGFY